jgi:hypothetical protein
MRLSVPEPLDDSMVSQHARVGDETPDLQDCLVNPAVFGQP